MSAHTLKMLVDVTLLSDILFNLTLDDSYSHVQDHRFLLTSLQKMKRRSKKLSNAKTLEESRVNTLKLGHSHIVISIYNF